MSGIVAIISADGEQPSSPADEAPLATHYDAVGRRGCLLDGLPGNRRRLVGPGIRADSMFPLILRRLAFLLAVLVAITLLTFALLHLACLDVMSRVVPASLAATAQAFYGTVAMGVAAAAVTLASGPLYEHFGPAAFWAMAALCGAVLPLASGIRVPATGFGEVRS